MTQAPSLRYAFGGPGLSAPALARVTDTVSAAAAQYDRAGGIPEGADRVPPALGKPVTGPGGSRRWPVRWQR